MNCSIPNLENPQCEEARNEIREFYSIHFGNDMKFSPENLKLREKFLSKDLIERLQRQPASEFDYFTQTDDYPKAFRVGSCEAISPERTVFQVLIFWKTETRSEQRELTVEAIKENDKWLISKVENK